MAKDKALGENVQLRGQSCKDWEHIARYVEGKTELSVWHPSPSKKYIF